MNMNGRGKALGTSKKVMDVKSSVKGGKSTTSSTNTELAKEIMSPQNVDADEMYNEYLSSLTTKMLLKSKAQRIEGDIDKQIAALQKRVKQSLVMLEESKLKLSAVCLMKEKTELLQFGNTVCETFADEPAFVKGKNFTELMSDIDQIRNQLPSKGIAIPDTQPDIDELQEAASQLLQSLEQMCAAHGAQQESYAAAAANLQEIQTVRGMFETDKKNAHAIVPQASTSTLKEIVSIAKNTNLHQVTK